MVKLRLLVVDDAKFIRDLVQKTLRAEYPEIELMEASDGRKAQAILERNSFDMILCDWEMPEMSGIELLEWVRAQENMQEQPFILVTSLDQKEHVVEALKAGVNDYVTKPFSAEQLISKVMKQLIKSGKITREEAMNMGRKERISSAGGAELLTGGGNPLVSAAKKPTPARRTPKGKAILLVGEQRMTVLIRDINKQEAQLLGKLSEGKPSLAEEVTLGLVFGREEKAIKTTVKAYISSLQLAERNQQTDKLNLTLQFLPQDAETSAKFAKILALMG
ncbi:response regulator [Marinospirillum insulare]|uniref:Two-component system response regulator n=1 Tax=Marinospirillum insulare TaxID=217169 RepID=A0ABQ5ZXL9_9GAMM|nr:response regulator [Marinospirillum insulare]GLR64043.1 two-component system response regulator [Marinospirillum insulare]